MRAVLGLLLLHGLLVWLGVAVLRAIGFIHPGGGRRATLAAVGPAFLGGVTVLVPLLVVLLVLGIRLTLPTAVLAGAGVAALAETIARRRWGAQGGDASPASARARARARARTPPAALWMRRALIAAASAYAAFGAFALARAPTRGDDARIWSLRGLTLAYYHGLQPEIFLNPFQAGAHPAYPLFQPVIEALVSEATGGPQLSFYHTELWLLFAAAIWAAGFLIWQRTTVGRDFRDAPVWLGALGLLAVTPAAIQNLVVGDADVIGSILLGTAALAFGVWIDQGDRGCLAFGALLLTGAASTKDEDLVASVAVLVIAGLFFLFGRRVRAGQQRGGIRRTWPLLLAATYFVVLVLPWRAWLAAHHLSDSVQPPLPRALSPLYVLGRGHQLHRVVTAMATQTLLQWGWLAAIFTATCVVCFMTRTACRIASYYLAASLAIVIILVWLYATTPLSLDFLLPTSMDRTVSVFMVAGALATAHMIASLVGATGLKPTGSRARGA